MSPAVLRCWALFLALALAPGVGAQERPPVGRQAAESLTYPPLDFHPPEPEVHTLGGGTRVLFLRDPTLPLVNVMARFRGGYSYFPRAYYAAGLALPSLLRSSGATDRPPASVDSLAEFHALQLTFGGNGEALTSTLNVLTRHLGLGLELWGDLLRHPAFDSARVEVWRTRQLGIVRRRAEDPARLAFSRFNRLMYGDHPVGWEMEPGDLEPDDLSPERLMWLHRRVVCPENLTLGVAGDVTWEAVEPLLQELLSDWPGCAEPLPEPPAPDIRQEGGVFLIPRELSQSTVVMAHASDVHEGDTDSYFASQVGNSILGGGGLGSRLARRLRTELGYAYSTSSLWTTPREAQGLVGAIVRTRSETTVAAAREVLTVLGAMVSTPPGEEEVARAVDAFVNGFVFNFDTPAQIVSRKMVYQSQGLPPDWLERYLDGIQRVDAAAVEQVFARYVRPDDMTLLMVGDPDAFDDAPDTLGDVTILPYPPSGGLRSPR